MSCRLNYIYEAYPQHPEFASILEQKELEIWDKIKSFQFDKFEYQGIKRFTLAPNNTKERQKQINFLNSLKKEYGSEDLFSLVKIPNFDISEIRVRIGTISEKEWGKYIFNKGIEEDVPIENEIIEEEQVPYSSIKKNSLYKEMEATQKAPIKVDNVVYSAVFFNTNDVISRYKQIYPNLYSHHSTIEFKPSNVNSLPIGKNMNIKIVGRLTTDKVDVLIVENPLSKNKYPHITLSTANGIKPFESNKEIENNLNKIVYVNDVINGVVGVFDGENEIISDNSNIQYQKQSTSLTTEQINQIQELKKSDPRWNKYSNEDVQRFIDSVFPKSKVKEVVYHGTDNTFEQFDKSKFRKNQKGNGLMFSGTVTSIEKEKGNQVEGFYFLKEKTSIYGKIILPVLLNIKNPKDFGKNIETMFFGDINPTYEKLSFVTPEELKEYKKDNIDGLMGEVMSVGNEIVVFEPSQIYILNSDKAIADMEKFVEKEDDDYEDNVSCFI